MADQQTYGVLHLFCGIGGAAIGMQAAESEYRGARGSFVTLAGIDCDPEACADFENLTGAPAVQTDLFSRKDYIAFHGCEPPEGWREVTPADLRAAIRRATGGVIPDVVFLSPPCKGFSGLLPAKSANSQKYQALNRLTVRGLWLVLEAFADDLPGIILLENVPRITSRGADLLGEIKSLLGAHGYLFHEGSHDCGTIGGLGQHRKRYLLMCRLPAKVGSFVYQPPELRVRSIGEIIGPLPMPDDPAGGIMHRLPRLQWKTWVRLALIPAGGDWRDLEKIAPEQYRLEYIPRGGGPFGVQDWEEPGATVIGNASIKGSNAAAIADPRRRVDLGKNFKGSPGLMGVLDWEKPSQSITGSASVTSSNCPAAVSDPRMEHYKHSYRVTGWDKAAGTITSGHSPSNGAACVSDPRLGHEPREGVYKVQKFDEPSNTVTGKAKVGTSNGATCIADPRLSDRDNRHPGVYRVVRFDEPGPCVTGTRFGSGAPAVADPRLNARKNRRSNSYTVRPWDGQAHTITGEDSLGSGAQSIADQRLSLNKNAHHNILQVDKWEDPAKTVTGATRPAGGAISVNDPRLGCNCRNGLYGVQDWDESANTVTGARNLHSGTAAVADPRIPADTEQGVWVIIAEDGTRHRPLTTWELMALQGFPLYMADGSPVVLAGNSDARWRERIGNAVPPPAAQAIGKQILRTLLVSREGHWEMSATPIWVRPEVEIIELP